MQKAIRKRKITPKDQPDQPVPHQRNNSSSDLFRCPWAKGEQYIDYHDREWGVPVHDDRVLFEFLILEGAQAGLSWETVLKKRDHYREAFDGFDPELIAKYGKKTQDKLLADPGIIRNRLKIGAAVQNAQAFLAVQKEFATFDEYIWRFVGGETKQNAWKAMTDVPVQTPESDAISKDLKRRGFRYVGGTICYAFMQAVGMVNDHLVECFRCAELRGHSFRLLSHRVDRNGSISRSADGTSKRNGLGGENAGPT